MQAVNVITGEVQDVGLDFCFTQFWRPLPKGDAVDSVTTLTVQEHLDTRTQIEEMLHFGQRLQLERARSFEDVAEEEAELDTLEPGIAEGADLVDVQRIAGGVNQRMAASAQAAADAAAAKAKAESDAADKARIDAAVAARLAELGK